MDRGICLERVDLDENRATSDNSVLISCVFVAAGGGTKFKSEERKLVINGKMP